MATDEIAHLDLPTLFCGDDLTHAICAAILAANATDPTDLDFYAQKVDVIRGGPIGSTVALVEGARR